MMLLIITKYGKKKKSSSWNLVNWITSGNSSVCFLVPKYLIHCAVEMSKHVIGRRKSNKRKNVKGLEDFFG